jgi:hypothetical protein
MEFIIHQNVVTSLNNCNLDFKEALLQSLLAFDSPLTLKIAQRIKNSFNSSFLAVVAERSKPRLDTLKGKISNIFLSLACTNSLSEHSATVNLPEINEAKTQIAEMNKCIAFDFVTWFLTEAQQRVNPLHDEIKRSILAGSSQQASISDSKGKLQIILHKLNN